VIIRSLRFNKAIPVAMIGVAFFFTSCQPRMPVKEEVGGERTAFDLHRMAEKYFRAEQYGKALQLFKRITEAFPDYDELSTVQYQIAESLYFMGEYRRSADASLEWLEKYPGHALRADVLILLGRNSKALGDNPRAFFWWLMAKEECQDDVKKQAELNEKLEAIMEGIDINEIEQLAGYAIEGDYAPRVYYKMATMFLERNQLENAKEATMCLIRSTSDQTWVSLGRQLLDKIEGETSVRKGVVGCLLPLTGPFAIYGEEVLNGIQLGAGMFDESEQDPALELVIRDTKGEPEDAVSGLEDLVINEKVMAIIGPLSSRTAVAVAKRAQELGVPIIALTQREGITKEGEMVFRNFLMPSQEVNRLVDSAVNERGMKRFCILYPDNSYGRFLMNLFWDRVEELGGTVTAVEAYQPDKTDFADQIKKTVGLYYPRPHALAQALREMRPPEQEESELDPEGPEPVVDFDAVFIPDNFQRVAMIAPQLAYHDVFDVQLMGTNLWQSQQLIEMAGDYVQDAIFPSGFVALSGEPGVEWFVKDYQENFDASPGVLAATGYDTIRLLKKVMALEGIQTRKDVQRALLGIQDFTGVTGNISFDPQGEAKKDPLLLTISGKGMIVAR
jgi:branched-chain amino acid transport system substrate-binding protein